MTSAGLLFLHQVGDRAGGKPWTRGLDAWSGPVWAPDLPGHGSAPPPVDGSYTLTMVLSVAAAHLPEDGQVDQGRPIVAGVGSSGWVALILALAGSASGLILVDGLGGPWLDPAETVAENVAWLRRMAEPSHSTPELGADPRLAAGVSGIRDRGTVESALAALAVPALVLSSPLDPLTADQRQELLGVAKVPLVNAPIASRSADAATGAMLEWAAARERSG